MSYRNIHIDYPQEIMRYRGKSITFEELCALTEEEIFEWNILHYGNTKFEDINIWISWIRCGFNARKAAMMVGYSTQYDGNGKILTTGATYSLAFRLERLCTQHILKVIRTLIMADKVTMEQVTKCLNNLHGQRSKEAKYWQYLICTAAVDKYKSEEIAAKNLHIERSVLELHIKYKWKSR